MSIAEKYCPKCHGPMELKDLKCPTCGHAEPAVVARMMVAAAGGGLCRLYLVPDPLIRPMALKIKEGKFKLRHYPMKEELAALRDEVKALREAVTLLTEAVRAGGSETHIHYHPQPAPLMAQPVPYNPFVPWYGSSRIQDYPAYSTGGVCI